MWYKSNNKYGNRKVAIDGITFDSKKEARRYQELRLLEKAGEIHGLQRQVKFVLIPAQREFNARETYKSGPKKGSFKPGRIIEREVAYVADFVYFLSDDTRIVEDTKGVRTKEYIIKRKLMLKEYGIRIKEV